MQQPPTAPSPAARTLETLEADLLAFEADGSQLSRAKLFNNAIRPVLLPIQLDYVCIPALHLDLGIYMWLFEAFISDMRQLDMALAAELGQAGTQSTDSTAFAKVAQLNSTLQEKTAQHEALQSQIEVVQSQVRSLTAIQS